MKIKILVLEDNELFLETLVDFLEDQDFLVESAVNGEEALKKCYTNHYDLYLLDVKVPLLNGFDFLKELRDSGDKTPAIFITSLNQKEDLSRGFESGCDDFMKKPLDLDELSLRIRALLKRIAPEETIKIDDIFSFNVKRKRLLKNNTEIDLNLKDAELLYILLRHRGKTVTKEMIRDALWNNEEASNDGSVRVYVNNLKKILGKDSIENIRSIGYKFAY